MAPLTATGANVWPPSVDSKNPLQFEPARQPTTASTTLPSVPGFTATSLTNALDEPPDCEQVAGKPDARGENRRPRATRVVAECRNSPRLVAASTKPLSKTSRPIVWLFSSSPPTRAKVAPPSAE